jgi:NAD(P)-dependent dehydrogenase (short-subunit alcohol dehydrogenase family)
MAEPSPVVAVTGASQGIGAAIALAFAREIKGVRLALVARTEDGLRRTAQQCRKAGARSEIFLCDVSNAASVELMAAAVLARWRAVDVLVNNAGKFAAKPFLETSADDFDAQIGANLRSVFLVARAFAPAMAARGRGDIFNMGSVAGLGAYPGGSGYCAAKFGVTGLSKVMRAELRKSGVRVSCVFPGATVSPSWDGSGVPEEKLMPAADVAAAFILAYRLSRRTVLEEITLRPIGGDL